MNPHPHLISHKMVAKKEGIIKEGVKGSDDELYGGEIFKDFVSGGGGGMSCGEGCGEGCGGREGGREGGKEGRREGGREGGKEGGREGGGTRIRQDSCIDQRLLNH